jgi:hypothetical protein
MLDHDERLSVSRRTIVVAAVAAVGTVHLLSACAPMPSSRGSGSGGRSRGSSDGAPGGPARLTADNSASVWRRGVRLAYADGMPIQRGDEIETDAANHALIAFDNGDTVYMSPVTRVRVGTIFVFFGEIFARIVSGQDTFRADSEVVSAGVERTEFLMRVNRTTKEATVTVRSGVVRCSSTGTSERWVAQRVEVNQQLTVPATVARPGTGGRPVAIQPKPIRLERAQVVSATQWVDGASRRLPPKLAPIERFDRTPRPVPR